MIDGSGQGKATFYPLRGCVDLRGRSLDEAANDGVGAVPAHDLVKPRGRCCLYTVWRRSHVAVHEGVYKLRALKLKFVLKLSPKSALLGFKDSARVVSHETNNPLVCSFLRPQEPGTVQRVKARGGHVRRVPDVMEHRGCLQQLRVVAQNWSESTSPLGDPKGVRPPTRQWLGQQRFGQRVRPLIESHGGQGYDRPAEVGRVRTVRPLP